MVSTFLPSFLGEGPAQLSTEQEEWEPGPKEAIKSSQAKSGGCKGRADTGSLALKELGPGEETAREADKYFTELALQGAMRAKACTQSQQTNKQNDIE